MLPIQSRLKSAKEIEYVFSQGFSAQSGFLFLKCLKTAKSEIRFAISIGKNFSPLAAKRNRAKRIVREEIKKILDSCQKGYAIVIFFRIGKGFPRDKFEKEVGFHLRTALEKARVITSGSDRKITKSIAPILK